MSIDFESSQNSPQTEAAPAGRTSRRKIIGWTAGIGAAGVLVALEGPKIYRGLRNALSVLLEQQLDEESLHLSYRQKGGTEDVALSTRNRFPYQRSPLIIYAEQERAMFPDHQLTGEALVIADNIANKVAGQAHSAVAKAGIRLKDSDSQPLSMEEALQIIGQGEHNLRIYCRLIADQLIRAQCIYAPEGSLSQAVDRTLNKGPIFHLDCDLLCLFALHCAARHDVPLCAYQAPCHMYIGSTSYPSLAVEMTEFRAPATAVNGIIDHLSSKEPGADFFSSHSKQRKRWRFSSPGVEERFGFFKPHSDSSLVASAIGNLLSEGIDTARQAGTKEAHEKVCREAALALEQHPYSGLVVQNAYAAHQEACRYYIKNWRKTKNPVFLEAGRPHVGAIEALKTRHEDFLLAVFPDRDENALVELMTGVNFEDLRKKQRELEELSNRLKPLQGE